MFEQKIACGAHRASSALKTSRLASRLSTIASMTRSDEEISSSEEEKSRRERISRPALRSPACRVRLPSKVNCSMRRRPARAPSRRPRGRRPRSPPSRTPRRSPNPSVRRRAPQPFVPRASLNPPSAASERPSLGALFSGSLRRGFSSASCAAARRARNGSSVFMFARTESGSRTFDSRRTRSASASNCAVCSARSFREPSSAASARRAFRSASVFSSSARAEALSRAVIAAASASSTRSFTQRNSSTFTPRARAAATSAGTVVSGSPAGRGPGPPEVEAHAVQNRQVHLHLGHRHPPVGGRPVDVARLGPGERRARGNPRSASGEPQPTPRPREPPRPRERDAASPDDSRVVRFFGSMLTQVGKYQIVEKIGVGGFGTVYKGRDPFIKRNVAIKTCQSEEEEIKKRFFREAEFAGNLHHRNVTTIYDFGVTDDGTPYIVQEFLTGDDLDKAIKKKEPLTLARKLQILDRRLRRARLRARDRDHPPRHQAVEHPHSRGRNRQDHGLRHREVDGLPVDAHADRASRWARRPTSRRSRSAARTSTRGPTSSRSASSPTRS